MEPHGQRGKEVARWGHVEGKERADQESRNSLTYARDTTSDLVRSVIQLLVMGGTYRLTVHPGLGAGNRRDVNIAYQAHLVFKALPSIITGFLLTEEERHLQL